MRTKPFRKTFYTLGNIITTANFLGFATEVKTGKCNHKGCGAIGPHAICDKCGGITLKKNAHWFDQGKCGQQATSVRCDGKLGPQQKSTKVSCKMKKYQTLTDEEVAHPDQNIELALIQITLAGRSYSSVFIVG